MGFGAGKDAGGRLAPEATARRCTRSRAARASGIRGTTRAGQVRRPGPQLPQVRREHKKPGLGGAATWGSFSAPKSVGSPLPSEIHLFCAFLKV